MKDVIDPAGQNFTYDNFEVMLNILNQTALVSVTDDKGTIIYVNDQLVQVSKYSRDELLGRNHRILKSGHQPQELFMDLWKTILSGATWRGEIKNRAKDGTYYWVDSSIAPVFNSEGKIHQYVSIRFLITDKKNMEEDLREHIRELEIETTAMVGRELKMAELKEEIKSLKNQLSQKETK